MLVFCNNEHRDVRLSQTRFEGHLLQRRPKSDVVLEDKVLRALFLDRNRADPNVQRDARLVAVSF